MIKDQASSLREMMNDKKSDRRENVRHKRPMRQQVVAIASGKGGVGKTGLSVNLGLAMAKKGHRVVVMDADLGLSNVNILVGELPKYNLFHVLKGQRQLKEIICKTKYGMDMIAGASGFSELANLSEEERMRFVDQVEDLKQYTRIIIDTGAGISSNVTSFLLAADRVLIVTTPEPTSVTDAYGIVKTLVSQNKNVRLDLVVNKCENVAEGKKVAERIGAIAWQYLKIRLNYLGIIYNDDTVVKALYKRIPYLEMDARAKCSIAVDAIASRLLNLPAEELESIEGFKGFFKRLIG